MIPGPRGYPAAPDGYVPPQPGFIYPDQPAGPYGSGRSGIQRSELPPPDTSCSQSSHTVVDMRSRPLRRHAVRQNPPHAGSSLCNARCQDSLTDTVPQTMHSSSASCHSRVRNRRSSSKTPASAHHPCRDTAAPQSPASSRADSPWSSPSVGPVLAQMSFYRNRSSSSNREAVAGCTGSRRSSTAKESKQSRNT